MSTREWIYFICIMIMLICTIINIVVIISSTIRIRRNKKRMKELRDLIDRHDDTDIIKCKYIKQALLKQALKEGEQDAID